MDRKSITPEISNIGNQPMILTSIAYATEDSVIFKEDSCGNDDNTCAEEAEELVRNINDLTFH